ncbi:hypothetical protein Rhopal_007038-T1 [Rhodotorula paludigena]|uniref:Uncharacterized protein n=1 Tax=Rhodotorula paludigena TaxID=86838 RepID=A0AAV5GWW2_9BASI|nr:hypothetical protein Rhopal_007038-T1 [Rhodotorula paludigena]
MGEHSKDRDRDDDRRRDRADDSGDEGPPAGVAELDDSDYFLKATELKLWLWEEKGKRLDSLRTEDARRYFKRFCKAWNRGRLDAKFYAGISPASLPSSISTSHSWSFSKASQQELDTAASVRKSIDTGSKVRSYDSAAPVAGPSRPPPGAGGAATLGPTLPPSSAVERLQMDRDARDSARQAERNASSSQRRREARDARDDERDERATGRDRVVEKRREGNASRRAFEAGREGGGMLEFDDEALLGGETGKGGPAGSFQDALRQRDAAQQRRQERKFGKQEERQAEMSDRLSAHRQKEDATMAMFKQLAAQRFGAPPS